ncbi:hypothetical protein NEFER03_1654 [Nematocida sp. LUAm3]|nr:hypothetical protein NEFER03_1654 [Nematocida sp. LUAm3]KAI5174678.1 hypothetical protein NEFER02_0788 [Nematocida sp. LUAm2]KAI5177911.1 hypothetical protein NEFER01_1113 [Nematocida sp. LUAm1]
MRERFEEELEFFEFLPSEIYKEIYSEITRSFEKYIPHDQRNSRPLLDKIENAIEKNLLIFERFTLRNIFTFPEGFVYERRATTERVPSPEETRYKVLSASEKKEELSSLYESISQKKETLKELQKKQEELKEANRTEDLLLFLKSLKSLLLHLKSIKRECSFGVSPEKLGKALEEEIRRRECMSLEKKVPINILKALNETLQHKQ